MGFHTPHCGTEDPGRKVSTRGLQRSERDRNFRPWDWLTIKKRLQRLHSRTSGSIILMQTDLFHWACSFLPICNSKGELLTSRLSSSRSSRLVDTPYAADDFTAPDRNDRKPARISAERNSG